MCDHPDRLQPSDASSLLVNLHDTSISHIYEIDHYLDFHLKSCVVESLTFAIQCFTEANSNPVQAYISPYLTEEDFDMCTIITHLDPQKKTITNVLMFGEKQKLQDPFNNQGPQIQYQFDQNQYVLRTHYSCFDEQCNSLDQLMAVLREESYKKSKGSMLARITLLSLENGLMDVTPGRFGNRNAVAFTLCAYMFTLFALIAFIHMAGTFLMLFKHFKKKKA